MTTTPTSPQERQPTGRTVRDIVDYTPAQVNELWCRKILRQLLQSLDTQYANGAPHRLIMPDTIVVQPSGDAILLPDPDANTDFQPEVAADLRALAAVIHFAISHEMPASGPLVGRGLAGYSDSLLNAVDRCMTPNKTQRPQTVAELRDLLGMVSVGLLKPSGAVPAVPSAAPATPAPTAASVVTNIDHGAPASGKRWLWIGLAAVLLAGALYIVRQHGAEELVGAPVQPAKAETSAPAPVPAPTPVEPDPAPAAAPVTAPASTPETAPPTASAEPAVPPTASYRLMINPWGTVYVDGKRRGVSPPLKRLALPTGRHTIMLENPGFPDRVIEVNSVAGRSGQIAHNFLAGAAPAAAAPADGG